MDIGKLDTDISTIANSIAIASALVSFYRWCTKEKSKIKLIKTTFVQY